MEDVHAPRSEGRTPRVMAASGGPSRRPHRKSRRGCLQCKQRRIKCDEGKPSCAKCAHYSTACSFLQVQPSTAPGGFRDSTPSASEQTAYISTPSSTRSTYPTPLSPPKGPPGLSSPNAFSIHDLQLFHHFTTTTYLTIPCRTLWPPVVSTLAFDHPFITHEIIALSALHLSEQYPARRPNLLPTAHYHHQLGLVGFQETLRSINESNCHACLMAASLLTLYTWASHTGNLFLPDSRTDSEPSSQVDLVQLLLGQHAIIRSTRSWLYAGPMWPMFKPWIERDRSTETALPEDDKHLAALEVLFNSPSQSVDTETVKTTWLALRMIFAATASDNGIEDSEATLGWLTQIPEEYMPLVQRHNPEALVVLAHYCVLLHRIDGDWWLKGSAKKLLGIIRRELGIEWLRWIEWPLREVGMLVDGAGESKGMQGA